jgi:hypothetical protein
MWPVILPYALAGPYFMPPLYFVYMKPETCLAVSAHLPVFRTRLGAHECVAATKFRRGYGHSRLWLAWLLRLEQAPPLAVRGDGLAHLRPAGKCTRSMMTSGRSPFGVAGGAALISQPSFARHACLLRFCRPAVVAW